MTQPTTDRYAQICRAFVKLADKFQKLDVEHMTLKSKVVPILRLLRKYKEATETLNQENQALEQALQAITLRYEALKLFDFFLEPEFQALLHEAEVQLELVDETLQEIEDDYAPDLDALDKALLIEYQNYPDNFEARLATERLNHAAVA